ncbi:MAG: alpha/beta hydrolase [Chitinophagaceae bacterium]|nr:alpha/beta hydrolase [Chitinophagaceae bacterium]
MKFHFIIFLLSCTLLSCSQNSNSSNYSVIYSTIVKDSFEIYVSTPSNMDTTKSYDIIYYCDANLKSGKKLRELIKQDIYSAKVNNTIFVGVGHIGNFHVLRRRDFILPEFLNGDTIGSSKNYGQTENFYQFLKIELIPKINSAYKTNPNNNSILGHSLGGLFAFYCLFKNDTLFESYYALSPSLWIDNYSIYNFNSLSKESPIKRNLYFSTGSLEIFNHIKTGTNKMDAFLNKQKYQNLIFKYDIHDGKTHNSQVEKSLDYILRN